MIRHLLKNKNIDTFIEELTQAQKPWGEPLSKEANARLGVFALGFLHKKGLLDFQSTANQNIQNILFQLPHLLFCSGFSSFTTDLYYESNNISRCCYPISYSGQTTSSVKSKPLVIDKDEWFFLDKAPNAFYRKHSKPVDYKGNDRYQTIGYLVLDFLRNFRDREIKDILEVAINFAVILDIAYINGIKGLVVDDWVSGLHGHETIPHLKIGELERPDMTVKSRVHDIIELISQEDEIRNATLVGLRIQGDYVMKDYIANTRIVSYTE